jgi:signal transduction histidine kinase
VGLAIVKKIIEDKGGTISLESQLIREQRSALPGLSNQWDEELSDGRETNKPFTN